MKKLIFIFIASFFIVLPAKAIGNNPEETDGTKISLWIPGIFIKFVGKMADKHAEEEAIGSLIQKFGSVSICIREGDKYSEKSDKKVTRKINRLDKRGFENLIIVQSDETTVDVRIKENKKGVIKRLSFVIDEQDETFVYLKVNCKIKPENIVDLINKDLTEIVH